MITLAMTCLPLMHSRDAIGQWVVQAAGRLPECRVATHALHALHALHPARPSHPPVLLIILFYTLSPSSPPFSFFILPPAAPVTHHALAELVT
ncbi:hypothetical protein E2C01_055013 [Portunus trituberculatus]|uniref:Uncharacterized protein n=1 Tax=Portunus trituberculatus TaxID=210409 RepID=A0A5B7GLB3_PORTR|nr:hypothetical protein [Portunus trituberculatus]